MNPSLSDCFVLIPTTPQEITDLAHMAKYTSSMGLESLFLKQTTESAAKIVSEINSLFSNGMAPTDLK